MPAWPITRSNGFTLDSTAWNEVVNALQVWGNNGGVNANGQSLSALSVVNIATTAADLNGLLAAAPALVGAGTQTGPRVVMRANSWDTANHTRDFIWRPATTTNAGNGALSLLTSLDGSGPTSLITIDHLGALTAVGALASVKSVGGFFGMLAQNSNTGGVAAHNLVSDNLNFLVTAGSSASGQNFFGIYDFTASAYRVTILPTSGFVGIGNTGPTVRLHVGGAMGTAELTAPATPASGNFYIYMDASDHKLKCKGPSGTVTILGNP